MKHHTTILAAVLCAVCLSGCDSDLETRREKQRIKIQYCPTEFEYKGHQYIYFSHESWTEAGVVHDPDCPCHKNNPELLNEK